MLGPLTLLLKQRLDEGNLGKQINKITVFSNSQKPSISQK
jgi:hypothetical protein